MSVPGRLRPWSWGAWLRSKLLPAWPLLEATCLQPLGGTRPKKQPSVWRPPGPGSAAVGRVVSSQAGMPSLFCAIVIRSRHCGISYKVPITKFPSYKIPSFNVYNYKIPKLQNYLWVQSSYSTKLPITTFSSYNLPKLCTNSQ